MKKIHAWRKIVGRVLLALASFAALSVLALVVGARRRGTPTFEAPYPRLAVSTDPAVVARGEYLARGPGHCVDCHGAGAPDAAPDAPLAGGYTFDLPVGRFHVPNITPDEATGIGRLRDDELARVLRHGVMPDGRAALPIMPFTHLADDDVVALLSYLRAQPPVRHAVPAHEPNLLGEVVIAYVLEPKGPIEAIPTAAPVGVTAERGAYLVRSVANCAGCHTRVDLRTGERLGPELAGGNEMKDDAHPERAFTPPSLRPDPRTHRVTGRSEDAFVARFRAGMGPAGSPMPWDAFGRMTEDDLRAIHRYLAGLPSSGAI